MAGLERSSVNRSRRKRRLCRAQLRVRRFRQTEVDDYTRKGSHDRVDYAGQEKGRVKHGMESVASEREQRGETVETVSHAPADRSLRTDALLGRDSGRLPMMLDGSWWLRDTIGCVECPLSTG